MVVIDSVNIHGSAVKRGFFLLSMVKHEKMTKRKKCGQCSQQGEWLPRQKNIKTDLILRNVKGVNFMGHVRIILSKILYEHVFRFHYYVSNLVLRTICFIIPFLHIFGFLNYFFRPILLVPCLILDCPKILVLFEKSNVEVFRFSKLTLVNV